MKDIYLTLENGMFFKGKSFGATGTAMGEVVFTTSMGAYLDTLSDPDYFGQIVVQTFPLIGNHGIISSDYSTLNPYLSAYVVKEWCREPSNFRCEGDLDTFLKANNIIGLYDIDTRALTKIISEQGTMRAKIDFDNSPDGLKSFDFSDAVAQVSCKSIENFPCDNPRFTVVLWDFGTKQNIIRELRLRNINIIKVPHNTTAEQILDMNPQGLILSNGPGNPNDNENIVNEIKKLLPLKIPTMAVSLGHQLLATANGAKTTKMKSGHRGSNHSVKDTVTNKLYVTTQNHSFIVSEESVPSNAKISFVNVNDGTCEGLTYPDMPVFSVQFIPETTSGTLDTGFLYDKFVALMEENKNALK